jgi:glyoxylase-like metal-dependent hydrolase (beta-lactamase superfamily II)
MTGRIVIICALVLILPPEGGSHLSGQQGGTPAVTAVKVQGQVWMITGAGGNLAMQVGDDGVVLVDTGRPGTSDAVLAAIARVTDKPIRYIINTSAHGDHVGNNAVLATRRSGPGGAAGATPGVIAHERVLGRMSTAAAAGAAPFPVAAWPTDAYIWRQRNIFFNGEPIDIIHQPAAHSDGDSLVYFRASNVLVAGDIFTTTSLPLVDRQRGGTSAGLLAALNTLLDIAVPAQMQEGGTYVIPGHGRISDEADVVEYRDMLRIVRDRMEDLVVRQKLPLPQVKAQRPWLGFAERYARPEWTADMITDTMYEEFRAPGTR